MEVFLIFVVIVLVFMFLQSLNSRKRRQKQQDSMQRALVPGAWVMTTSGYYGQFVEQDGQVLILQTVDGTETFWDQRAFARVVDEPPFATPAPQGQDRDEDVADSPDAEAEDSAPAAAGAAGSAALAPETDADQPLDVAKDEDAGRAEAAADTPEKAAEPDRIAPERSQSQDCVDQDGPTSGNEK